MLQHQAIELGPRRNVAIRPSYDRSQYHQEYTVEENLFNDRPG